MAYIPTNFSTTAVINADTLFQNYDDEVQVLMSDVGNYLSDEIVKVYTETEIIVTDGIKVNSVETIEDLATQDGVVFKTIIVKDLNRGGTFIWSSTGTANGGTVFAGVSGFWNRQYDGAVSVKWFGAKGDGSVDSRVEFQNAIKYSVAANKTISIPDGIFLLDSIDSTNPYGCAIFIETDYNVNISCSSGANIIAGAGLGDAIANYLGHGAIIRIQRISDVTGGKVTLSGGRFDLSALPSTATGCNGVSIGPKYSSVNIAGVTFDHGVTTPLGANNGIGGGDGSLFCKEPENISVTNCQFLGAPDLGIYLSGDNHYPARIGRHAYIAGNYFYRCANGIAAKRDFQNTIIQGNCFLENGGGIFLGVADGSIINTGKRIIVNGNVITKTQGNPIRIANSPSAIVTGNEIFDYRRWVSDGTTETGVESGNIGGAIMLEGTRNFSITGNSIGFNEWAPISTENKFTSGISLKSYTTSLDPLTVVGCSNGVVLGNSIRSVYCAFYTTNDAFGLTLSPNSIADTITTNKFGTGQNTSSIDLLGDVGTGMKWINDGVWSATGNGVEVARFEGVVGDVNHALISSSPSGNPVLLMARGVDTHIDLSLLPRGSKGRVRIGTHTSSPDVAISGYIEIKDADGTPRKLAVI